MNLLNQFNLKAWRSSLAAPPLLLLTALLSLFTLGTFAQTTLLSGTSSAGSFEGASLSADGWTTAQSATNYWVNGTALASDGSKSAFVTNDGTTNGYNPSGAQANHMYRDFTAPVGENIITLTFDLKGNPVDVGFDRIRVYVAPITATPVAGTEATSGATQVFSFDGNLATFTAQTVGFGTNAAGSQNFRVIFTWRNDGSGGSNPPYAIDKVNITSTTPSTSTATAQGGLWSSPGTWVGGVAPVSGVGNSVVIPAGSVVTVDQAINYANYQINGVLQWNATAPTVTTNAMTSTGNINIGSNGRFYPFSSAGAGAFVYMLGNFVNDGYANLALSVMVFGGSGTQTLGGSGTYEGVGGSANINALTMQGSGTLDVSIPVTVRTLSSLQGNISGSSNISVNNRNTNLFGSTKNTINNVVVTNMGSGYTTAPVVGGNTAALWGAGTIAAGNLRINAGHQYVALNGTSTTVAPTHTSYNVVAGADAISWLHVGPVGTIGTAFAGGGLTPTAGTQYFYNGKIYTCITAAAMTLANISAATPFPTALGASLTIGTTVFRVAGDAAVVTVNHDATNQVVRSLSIATIGTGYTNNNPAIAIVANTTGTGAAATALRVALAAGAAGLINKQSAGNVGTPNISSTQGIGGVTSATDLGFYLTAPTVGVGGPTGINFVTAGGSGYTAAPTVAFTGGTTVSGTSTFTTVVANGQVLSITLNASALYSVPPTAITITGGGGTGATAAIPAGCWAQITAALGANGQINSYSVGTPGFGYVAAPTLALSTAGAGERTATTPTCVYNVYNLTPGNFTPSTINGVLPTLANGAHSEAGNLAGCIPSNRRIGTFAMGTGNQGVTLTGGLTLYNAAPITLTSGALNMGGNTLAFEIPSYLGASATAASWVENGSIQLNGISTGTFTRTFPFRSGGSTGSVQLNIGSGSNATGSNITRLTVQQLGAPSGSATGGGNMTGTRSYQVTVNAGTLFGTTPTMLLGFAANDNLVSDNAQLFLCQSNTGVTSGWTARSVTSGTGALPGTGTRTSATTGVGPIVFASNMYFGWSSTFTPAPALNYSVSRTTANAYTSIAPVGVGGNGSGQLSTAAGDETTQLVTWTGSTFTYQGETVTGFRIHPNGYIMLQTASYTPLEANSWDNTLGITGGTTFDANKRQVIAPFYDDHNKPSPVIYYNGSTSQNATTVSGNIVTVEWFNTTHFGLAGPQMYFQVVLNATDGTIKFNYGDMQLYNGTQNIRYAYTCGISGRFIQGIPQAGQIMAQQYENTTFFTHENCLRANTGANGLSISPEPRSSILFTPGTYVPVSAPVAAAPANDEAAGAITLPALLAFPSNIAWNNSLMQSNLYSTRYATPSSQAFCDGSTGKSDVWFKITAIDPNTQVRVYPSGGFIPRMEIKDASFNDLIPSQCVVAAAQGGVITATLAGLTVGDDYYIRVYHDRAGVTAQATATISGGSVTGITVNTPGTNYPVVAQSFGYAAANVGPIVRISGGGGSGANASITTPTTTQILSTLTNANITLHDGGSGYTSAPTVTIESPNSGITGEFGIIVFAKAANDDPDLSVAGVGAKLIRSQGTCVAPVTLTGVSTTAGSSNITFTANTGLTVGSTVIVSGSALIPYNALGSVNSSTSITLSGNATGTVSGLTLTAALNNYVQQSTGTASATNATTYPVCTAPNTGIADDDVWYQFRAPVGFTGARFEVQGANDFDPYVEIWNGTATTATGAAAINCTNATGANGLEASDFATVANNYYYIRVYHAGTGAPIGSTFDICLRPACTSAATAGTGETVSPTTLNCLGGNVVTMSFGSSASQPAAGIVYTWQSSPDGIAWSNIPGASGSGLTSYTTPSNVTNTIYYRGQVSCTNQTPPVTVASTTAMQVTAPYPIAVSQGVNLCAGNPTAVSVTAGASGANPYTSFVWAAPSGVTLYEDAAGTTPYVSGTSSTSLTTVYASSTTVGALPAGLTVTGSAIVAAPTCQLTSGSATGTVLALPATPAITASATSICSGDDVDLSAPAIPVAGTFSPYCTPTAATSTPLYGIASFSTTGATANITNNSTGIATSGYTNYSSTLNCTQAVGGTVNFSVATTSGTNGIAIWVDWNQDGDFADAGEKAANTTGYVSTFIGSFTVPATAVNGATRMRVMSDYFSTNPSDPCAAGNANREVEDYSFTVTNQITAYQWSNGIAATTASVNTGAINTFPQSYNARSTNGVCLSNASNTITIVQAGTPTAAITSAVPVSPYATVTTSFTGDEDIVLVRLRVDNDGDGTLDANVLSNSSVEESLIGGTLSPATGAASRYSNYTAFGPFTLDATKAHRLIVNSNFTTYEKQNAAWIDWNQDGDFADEGECIFVTTPTVDGNNDQASSNQGPYVTGIQSSSSPFLFNVPAGAKNGNTRLRVVCSETDGLTSTPPTSVSWGEWEDYTINVINSTAFDPCPGSTFVLNANAANGGEPYTYAWSVVSGGATLSSASAAAPTIVANADQVVRVDITDNCGNTTFSQVTVGVFDSPLAITPSTTTVCGNPGTTFVASGGSNYTWTPNDPAAALNVTTGATVIASPVANKTYTVTGTYGAGCVGTAQATLNYTAPPAITVTNSGTANNIYCGEGTYTSTLTASSSATYTYTWTNGSGGSAADNVVQVSNGVVTATANNSYVLSLNAVEVGGAGCILNQTQSVTIFDLPEITMSATPSVIGLGSTSTLASGVVPGAFSVTNCLQSAGIENLQAIPTEGTSPGQSTYLVKDGVALVTQTTVSLDDGGWANIPIGFSFNFFGTSYNTVNVGTNGLVQFGTYNATSIADFTFAGFPNTTDPLACIAGCAQDLNLGADPDGSIAYWVEGSAPTRKFVVAYQTVNTFGSAANNTFQIVLNETTGKVVIQKGATLGTGGKTIGVNGPSVSFTGSISGNELTVTAAAANSLRVGQAVGTTGTNYGTITALGTGAGDVGTYTLSASNTVASTTLITVVGTTAPNCSADPSTCTPTGATACTWRSLTGAVGTTYAWRFNPPVDYAFDWQPSAGIQGGVNNLPTAIAAPTSTGTQTYSVLVTDNLSGCSNAANLATVNVTVIGAPSAPTVSGEGLLSQQESSSGTVNFCGPQSLGLQVNADPVAYPATQGSQALTYSLRVYDAPTGGSNLALSNTGLGSQFVLPIAFPPAAGVTGAYCTPSNTTTIYGINSLSTTGAEVNFTNNGTGVTTGGYSNYTSTKGIVALPGQQVTVNFQGVGTSAYGLAAWIDYNQNGTFETTERVLATTNYINAGSGIFTVSPTAPQGLTRMRVLSHFVVASPTDPCQGGSSNIEIEDYAVQIGALAGETFSANTTRYVSVYNGFAESPRTQVDFVYATPPAVTVTGVSANGSSSATPVVCGPALALGTNGYSSQLTGSGPVGQTPAYSFSWGLGVGQPGNLNGSQSVSGSSSVTANMSNSLAVNYVANDGAGCIVNNTISITRNDFPAVTAVATPAIVCAGETSALTATGVPATGFTYAWSSVGANGSVSSATSATASGSTSATNQYQLVVTRTSDGCDNSDNQPSLVTVDVPTVAPTVLFTSNTQTPTTGGVLQTVTFTVDDATTPAYGNGGSAMTYLWTFTGPSPSIATTNVTYVGGTGATTRNPQVQFNAPGVYTAALTVGSCNGAGSQTRSNYITASAVFCNPVFSGACANPNQAIENVQILDDGSNQIMLHASTGCTSANSGYTNYGPPAVNNPVGGVTTCTMFQGVSYSITATSPNATPMFFGCWIDGNNDGDFADAGEYLSGANSTAAATATFSLTVPSSGLIVGLHRMRIVASSASLNASSSCLSTLSGEAHDYSVNYQPNAIANDIPQGSVNVIYSSNMNFPNAIPRTATLAAATNSSQTPQITGPDIWFKFIAMSTAVSITMSSSSMDDIIALYSFNGTSYSLVTDGLENATSGASDFERLNVGGLTPGQTYYVAFGTNDAIGGTFSYVIQHLMPSGCSYVEPAGGFTLCRIFKANYRGGVPTTANPQGTYYTFGFTPINGTGGSATSVSGTNGLVSMANPTLALRYNGEYNVKIDLEYNLLPSTGPIELITIEGSTSSPNCSGVSITSHPLMEVRSSQRCPATLLRSNFLIGSTVAGSTSSAVCNALNYTYEFTQVTSCADGTVVSVNPVIYTTVATTPYLALGVLGNLPNAGAWDVRIRPNFSYGTGTYGPVQRINVNNTSNSAMLDEEVAEMDEKVESFIAANLYPNPNNGEMVNLNVSGIESDNVFVRITDAMGRIVYTNRFAVEGSLNTIVTFAEPLASGIYNVEFTVDGQIMTERMIVAKQ